MSISNSCAICMKLTNDTYTYEADFLCMNRHTAHTDHRPHPSHRPYTNTSCHITIVYRFPRLHALTRCPETAQVVERAVQASSSFPQDRDSWQSTRAVPTPSSLRVPSPATFRRAFSPHLKS